MTKWVYKLKKNKTLPIFIGLIMGVSFTAIIRLFAGEIFLPEWSVYGIPLIWIFCAFLVYVLSRGTLEVTTSTIMIKAGDEIVDQMQIKDIQTIEKTVVDESVLAGSAGRVSVGRYLVFKDKKGKQLKVNRTAYSEQQLEEVVQYIESCRSSS